MKKIGFIGCGNIGKAILCGLITSEKITSKKVWVYVPSLDKLTELQKEYNVNMAKSAKDIVKITDIFFIAVKPNIIVKILSEIALEMKKESLLVSIAAGVTIDQMMRILGNDKKIIRIMTNMSALVNSAITSITPNNLVTSKEIKEVSDLFRCFGKIELIEESMIHQVISISSSALAYIFMFIESLSDAAVLGGMSRTKAYRFSSQSVIGAAKMIMKTGKHPAELKDYVCSPGGTTIEAVRVLESHNFRSSIIEAAISCAEKSKKISQT